MWFILYIVVILQHIITTHAVKQNPCRLKFLLALFLIQKLTLFSVKQTIDSSQNAVDIEEECPEKDDEYVEEKDDDELARNLSSADFHDSEEEEEEEEYTKVERGRVKGKLVWDESSLPY